MIKMDFVPASLHVEKITAASLVALIDDLRRQGFTEIAVQQVHLTMQRPPSAEDET